jgi:hypothetical protein
MSAPGILTGSNAITGLFRQTSAGTTPASRTGVFGKNPGATPKYALNDNRGGRARDAEYRDTLARLYIEVPPGQLESFLASVSAETRQLAQVLAGGGATAGSSGTGFLDFLLTGAQESFQERAQIVETLSDNYVAFYSGQSAPVFQYSGVVLNTYQDDQRVWMMRLYNEILRGTKLANRNLVAKLRYDSFIVAGYLESLNTTISGDQVDSGNFNFTLRVKRFSVFTPSLGAPTIVAVNDSSGAGLTTTGTAAGATERVATVTPDVPPTATVVPAADGGPALSDEEVRERLRGVGLSDGQIDAAIDAGIAAGAAAEVDTRETDARAGAAGLDRLRDFVTGDGTEVNPDSVSDDASGGLTNVYGTVPQVDTGDGAVVTGPITRRSGARQRGGRAAA